LGLGQVKVVRNDLCEADLEVVAGKGGGAAAKAIPPPEAVGAEQAGGLVWERLGSRLFSTGRTR
jgi:hypothetical protein